MSPRRVGVGDGRAHEPAPVGALPSVRGGRSLCLRKEASGAAPAFAHHSVTALGFRGGPGFFHKHFHLWSSSSPSPRAISSEPAVVPSRVCVPTRTVRHPALIRTDGRVPQAGAHGLRHEPPVWVSFHAACPQGSSMSPLISLLVRALPQMREPLLTLSDSRGTGPIQLPLLFFLVFLFSLLPRYVGIFLVLLGVRGPLLVFSGCPAELFHL